MKDKYLFGGLSGNQNVGWCTCGLNYLEKTSAVYPDYFYNSEYEKFGKIKIKKGRVVGTGSDHFLVHLLPHQNS